MKIALLLVLMLLAHNASADESVGVWQIITSQQNMRILKTLNADGSATGIICNNNMQGCGAFVQIKIDCKENSKYPALINSAVGANGSDIVCFPDPNGTVLIFEDMKAVTAAFESGGQVGFVIPLKDGQFRVDRFNCAGAALAMRKFYAPDSTPVGKATPATQML